MKKKSTTPSAHRGSFKNQFLCIESQFSAPERSLDKKPLSITNVFVPVHPNWTCERCLPATSSAVPSANHLVASRPTLPWKRHASDKAFQEVNTNIPQHQSYSINTASTHPGLIWKPMGSSSPQRESKSRKMLLPC